MALLFVTYAAWGPALIHTTPGSSSSDSPKPAPPPHGEPSRSVSMTTLNEATAGNPAVDDSSRLGTCGRRDGSSPHQWLRWTAENLMHGVDAEVLSLALAERGMDAYDEIAAMQNEAAFQ